MSLGAVIVEVSSRSAAVGLRHEIMNTVKPRLTR